MKVVGFLRSIVALLIAAFTGAASFTQPFTSIATAQPAIPPPFAAEARDIEAASARLQDFEELANRLDKAASVSRSDFETLQRNSQAAKNALPVLQRQLPSVVTKLKSSGKWTQAFDEGIVRRLQRTGQTELLQAVQAAGGVLRLLEQAAAEIPLTSAEIDATLRRLQPKAAWHWLAEPFLGQRVYAQGYLKKWQVIKGLFEQVWQCVSDPHCGE